jgi:hypothetical protein
MNQFWKDTRPSLRILLRRPAFLAVSVLTLALGIGANTAIFSVVNTILLRQLPFKYAERTVWITGVRPERSDASFSLPDFLDYRDRIGSLDSLSAIGGWSGNLTGQGDAEQLNGVRVSANLFETLGVNAVLGRTLEPDDDRPGSPRVVVMTDGLWQRRFGGDISLISGVSYTLVGILPANFFFPIPGGTRGASCSRRRSVALRSKHRKLSPPCGPHAARLDTGAGASGNEHAGCQAAPAISWAERSKARREVDSHARSDNRWLPPGALGALGRCRACALNRMRQSCELESCARLWAPKGNGNSFRTRRCAVAARQAALRGNNA